MADVAVLAQSPLAEQPDDTAQQVRLCCKLQSAQFVLLTLETASLFVRAHCLHSSSCCKLGLGMQLTIFVLSRPIRGPYGA